MNEEKEKIKKIVDSAIEIVGDYDDPYKCIAFEVILKMKLNASRGAITVPVSTTEEEADEKETSSPMSVLAKKAGVKRDDITTIYFAKDDKLGVIADGLKDKNKKDLQMRLVYLYILGKTELLGVEEVHIEEIPELMKEHAVYDTNFSNYLSKEKKIRKAANSEGKKCYFLTTPGKNYAMEIIREIVS